MAGRREFFLRGSLGGKISVLQFGGSGNDYAYCCAELPDGNILVSVKTYSTSYNGEDISAYTNGVYPAYGFVKITPNTMKIVGSFWLSGSAKIPPEETPKDFQFELVGTKAYFLWGTRGDGSADWRVIEVDTDTMTQTATSDTNMTVYYGYCTLRYYDSSFYVAATNSGGDPKVNLYKLNTSLAQTATNSITLPAWNPQALADMIVCPDGIYYVTGRYSAWPRHLVKCTLALAYSAYTTLDSGANFTNWNSVTIANGDTSVYVGIGVSDGYSQYLKAYKKSNLATPAGWTDWSLNTLISGQYDTPIYEHAGIDFDVDGRLWLFGGRRSSYENKFRVILREFNPSTGALISTKYVKYPNALEVATTSKTLVLMTAAKRIKATSGKYYFVGYMSATVALNGFAALGGADSFIIRTDADGVIG